MKCYGSRIGQALVFYSPEDIKGTIEHLQDLLQGKASPYPAVYLECDKGTDPRAMDGELERIWKTEVLTKQSAEVLETPAPSRPELPLLTGESRIADMAQRHGWKLEKRQHDISMLIYVRGNAQVNVYTTTMTVATSLNHPVQGKTQLFRRRVSHELLDQILRNPRVHTDKGYQRAR